MSTALRLLVRIAFLGSLSSPGIASAADTTSEVPKEVMALVGTYSGSWKSFGIDAQGQVVLRSAWTDTMKADRPVREAERAWVSTEDVMTFDGRPGAPFKLSGKEGYRFNRDGTLAEYFIETFGQTYRMQKLAEGIWIYALDVSTQELAQLGFPKGAAGRHVVVKVVTNEAGVETHRISRITTSGEVDFGVEAPFEGFVHMELGTVNVKDEPRPARARLVRHSGLLFLASDRKRKR